MAVIGVDVGGTKVLGGVVTPDLEVLASEAAATPPAGEALLDEVAAVIRRLARAAPEPVTAVGVGIPSLIDFATGRVRMSVNVDMADMEVVPRLRAAIDRPIVVDNDGNLAALVEHRAGAGRGHEDLVMLTLGTGIGGGVILGGRPMRGGRGTGAELGHITVQADGPPCHRNCPNHGCLETFVSGTAIVSEARAIARRAPGGTLAREERVSGGLTAPAIGRLAREGDPAARAVLEDAGRWLGVGLASLANIFAPSIFVIGGGLVALSAFILGPAREEYRRRALQPNAEARVVPAAFGAEAGMLGAALLAMEADGAGRHRSAP